MTIEFTLGRELRQICDRASSAYMAGMNAIRRKVGKERMKDYWDRGIVDYVKRTTAKMPTEAVKTFNKRGEEI